MTTPLVSVVMPVLNTAAYLPQAIESMLAQSLGDLELIIADDGSSDGSRDIAADYARRDGRIRLTALERDAAVLSGARACNAAIALSRGAFVARMDSDDIALPDRLAAQVDFLSARDLDICGGQCTTFAEGDGKALWHPTSRDGIRNELVFTSAAVNPTLMLRGDLMRAARYSVADAFEQYEFQTRIVFLGRWENLGEVVHRFRNHPASATRVFRPQKADSNWQLRFRYFFRLFPDAAVADFQAIHRIARGIAIADRAELETAGRWLHLLSRVGEGAVRARMARRWRETCAAAILPADEVAALQAEFEPRIVAAD